MSQNILIIEDEKTIADTIIYALKADGLSPFWHATGFEGLKHLKKNTISLVILDIGLPDVNGLELCKQIRSFTSIPIIFLTARSDEIDRIVGLEIGADDYVTKPFSPRELTARVRAILRRTNAKQMPPGDEKSKVERFAINNEFKTISYYGLELCLSKQEYKVLSTLIAHPGRVYSREELMNAAWDEPGFCTDRTVDSHIKSIRSKLRGAHIGIDDPIETHRGFGYSLKSAKI